MEKFSTYNSIFAENSGNKAAAWLYAPEAQSALKMLEENGGEARIIGGAVRDTLLGLPAPAGGFEMDIATTLLPEEVLARIRARGLSAALYAAEFGTILAVINGKPLQITTLRQDIATDGRHATVRFCRDWALDAARRDFTINALSVDRRGRLYDYGTGLADIKARRLRFIGAPEQRIKEDYLRILRYFRFYAVIGGGSPDRAALKAIAGLKAGLQRLSPERVWAELQKLLAAENPSQSLLWMRAAGVLALILPESEKWGIEALQGLLENEQNTAGKAPAAAKKGKGKGESLSAGAAEIAGKQCGVEKDPLLRLMAIIPPRLERVKTVAERLRLAGAQKRRLENWARQMPVRADLSETELQKRLYAAMPKTGTAAEQTARQIMADALAVSAASARAYDKRDECRAYQNLTALALNLPVPHLPVSGADMAARGLRGAQIGKALKRLEQEWLDSGFALGKQALLEKIGIMPVSVKEKS